MSSSIVSVLAAVVGASLTAVMVTLAVSLALLATTALGGHSYNGGAGTITLKQFGASAPAEELFAHYGFSVEAIVVQGQMWLTVAGQTRSLERGDRFQLDRDVPHSERYGAEGATYWVARRN